MATTKKTTTAKKTTTKKTATKKTEALKTVVLEYPNKAVLMMLFRHKIESLGIKIESCDKKPIMSFKFTGTDAQIEEMIKFFKPYGISFVEVDEK